MLAMFAMMAATAAAPPPETRAPETPAPEEIVVKGTKWKCRIEYANHVMSSHEFDARAADWAKGVPVRVIAPQSADYECLARITSRLGDKGVKLVYFVDPNEPADDPR